jgi:hypothetical protein
LLSRINSVQGGHGLILDFPWFHNSNL